MDRGENSLPENVRAQLLYSPETAKFEDLNKREARDWKNSIISTWQADNSFIIELNNKTLWRCSPTKSDWQVGDTLEFDINDEKQELKNLRSSEKTDATLINGSSEEIDLPIIKKISRKGKRIVLSDESVWFSITDGFKKWQKGNRIIVSTLGRVDIDTSTHLLINIDKDKDIQNCSSATLVK